MPPSWQLPEYGGNPEPTRTTKAPQALPTPPPTTQPGGLTQNDFLPNLTQLDQAVQYEPAYLANLPLEEKIQFNMAMHDQLIKMQQKVGQAEGQLSKTPTDPTLARLAHEARVQRNLHKAMVARLRRSMGFSPNGLPIRRTS
jgi:hypothetical protein